MTAFDILTAAESAVFAGLAARYFQIWFRMWRSASRLAVDRTSVGTAAQVPSDHDPQLVFIIPAFQETSSLPETIASLRAAIESSRYRAEIIVATSALESVRTQSALASTSRVHDPRASPESTATTIAVARKALADCAYATIVDDTSPEPSMARQFNAALAAVAAKSGWDEQTTYVVCYNADTTASPDTVEALGDTILAARFPQAAQLMCVSLRGLRQVRGPWRWYLLGAAYYQTRWALGFEFDMYRRSFRRSALGHCYYCRGHGITLRLDAAKEIGGLSTRTALEDLYLGFQLSLRGWPCYPVPVLEMTESPSTVRELLSQKKHWFSGMWDTLSYRRLMPEEYSTQPRQFRLLQARSMYRDIGSWLLGPWVPLFLIIVSIVTANWWFATLPVVNAAITTWFVRRTAQQISDPVSDFQSIGWASTATGVLIYSMTRNIGPLGYVIGRIRELIWRW